MTEKRYQAILFDLDGTLIDNHAAYCSAFELLCKEYPEVLHSRSVEQLKKVIGFYQVKHPEQAFQKFCKDYDWKETPSFSLFWDKWTAYYLSSSTPFPLVKETLAHLKEQGYLIGLITNGEENFQKAKLQFSGLLPYFDSVIVSGEVNVEKPDPKIYQLSANDLRVPISGCLFVGDTNETDIAGALAAGMHSMLVHNEHNHLNATYHANDISAVIEILT